MSTITYTASRATVSKRYRTAVKRAGFLSEEEKFNWTVLGSHLTERELRRAERLIIDEDLRRLKMKHSLERIKPNKN